MRKQNQISGQAVIIVITVLVMMFIVGVAFYSLSQAERIAGIRNLDSLRARYITEAGVAYAQKVLRLDRQTTATDSLEDLTFQHFSGRDADLDGDKEPESRWITVSDSQGNPFGRFSARICDEASKVNLNTCTKNMLEQLFSLSEMNTAEVDTLLSRRPFHAIEETSSVLNKEDFPRARNLFTIYSQDTEVDLDRKRRSYLNSSSAQVILEKFLAAGIKDAYEKAANLKDASDSDLAQTVFYKFIRTSIAPSGLSPAGSWYRSANTYVASAAGSPGTFVWNNLAVEDGEYFCFLYGPQPEDTVGEVDGQRIISGGGLTGKVKVESSSLSLTIAPTKDKECRFSYIDLVSTDSKGGLAKRIVLGTEAVVINELMVKPSRKISIDAPELDPGGTFRHTFTDIKPGDYHLVVLAKNAGGLVGDIFIHAEEGRNLRDGDYFPQTVNVDGSGALTVTVKNNSLGRTTFSGIIILQQPDAEFIELLNLCPQEIDLSNFSFQAYSPEGEIIPGWPARIPQGIIIKPYQHLTFAVDNKDEAPAPAHLRRNKISFQKIWNQAAAGLIFDEYADTLDRSFDLLPDGGGQLILKDAKSRQVDAVEYYNFQILDFNSLERADPSVKVDADGNGFFDGWYGSQSSIGSSSNVVNENLGMYTRDKTTNKMIKHSPPEVEIFNRPLQGLAEVLRLPSGESWRRCTIDDVARMADRFSLRALRLNLTTSYQEGEFKEKNGLYESTHRGDTGIWKFSQIPATIYLLSIFSESVNVENEKILAAHKTDAAQEFSELYPLVFKQGLALYGTVELPLNTHNFELKIVNDSQNKLLIKNIQLEPVYLVTGRININTAGMAVLRSILPENLTQTIMENRPLGIRQTQKLGIGELFTLNPEFVNFHDYLTVKSDVYEITCRGEYMPQDKSIAYQLVRTVIERGD